jgi:DNA polymerase III delta subunit
MTDQTLRTTLKKGEISNQYFFIGDEFLLIDNAINAVKKTINVNESFDLETFSLSETPFEDIIPRFYITPFGSPRRLIIIRHLEEVSDRDLATFAEAMSKIDVTNCVIMTYTIPKGKKKYSYKSKKLSGLFAKATHVTFVPDRQSIHKWIARKNKRDGLNLSASTVHYLEEEFRNDITGLKNEFEKIDNYLYEEKTLSSEGIKDLAQGLCDFNKYSLVDTFLAAKAEVLERFEELRPYLYSYAEIVDVLTRGLVQYSKTRQNVPTGSCMKDILEDLVTIDRKIKRSSYFADLMVELFLLTKITLFNKGVLYGREMA